MIVVDRRPAPERLLGSLDDRPDAALARLLVPAAALWEFGAAIRRRLRRELPLPGTVPTLGIGNLRVGGTGKTPVVEDLGRRLGDEGHRVAVLTRGYRGEAGGDEPAWLAASGIEVFADPNRRRGFECARSRGADRILLDDALQTRHRPAHLVALVLDRDLEAPPRTLPAGPAREGRGALHGADAIFVRREEPGHRSLPVRALGFRLRPDGFLGPRGEPVAAPDGAGILFCGLARPESFERDAQSLGLDLRGSWRETDHWSGDQASAEDLVAFARDRRAQWVLVPEKNLSRLVALGLTIPIYAMRSTIAWDGGISPLAWLRERGIHI